MTTAVVAAFSEPGRVASDTQFLFGSPVLGRNAASGRGAQRIAATANVWLRAEPRLLPGASHAPAACTDAAPVILHPESESWPVRGNPSCYSSVFFSVVLLCYITFHSHTSLSRRSCRVRCSGAWMGGPSRGWKLSRLRSVAGYIVEAVLKVTCDYIGEL